MKSPVGDGRQGLLFFGGDAPSAQGCARSRVATHHGVPHHSGFRTAQGCARPGLRTGQDYAPGQGCDPPRSSTPPRVTPWGGCISAHTTRPPNSNVLGGLIHPGFRPGLSSAGPTGRMDVPLRGYAFPSLPTVKEAGSLCAYIPTNPCGWHPYGLGGATHLSYMVRPI